MIPDYQTLMLPVLKTIAQGVHNKNLIIDEMAKQFELTPEERMQLLPSGAQRVLVNRVSWAITYMTKAGLVQSAGRGECDITASGRQVLASDIEVIDNKFLKKFPSFKKFLATGRNAHNKDEHKIVQEIADSDSEFITSTPEEIIVKAYNALNDQLAEELLKRVKSASPSFLKNY